MPKKSQVLGYNSASLLEKVANEIMWCSETYCKESFGLLDFFFAYFATLNPVVDTTRRHQEAIAAHRPPCLYINCLPSLCQLPVPRQTGQVSRQLACSDWQQRPNVLWASAAANPGPLISLNMASLQASSHRLPVSHMETACAPRQIQFLFPQMAFLWLLVGKCAPCQTYAQF